MRLGISLRRRPGGRSADKLPSPCTGSHIVLWRKYTHYLTTGLTFSSLWWGNMTSLAKIFFFLLSLSHMRHEKLLWDAPNILCFAGMRKVRQNFRQQEGNEGCFGVFSSGFCSSTFFCSTMHSSSTTFCNGLCYFSLRKGSCSALKIKITTSWFQYRSVPDQTCCPYLYFVRYKQVGTPLWMYEGLNCFEGRLSKINM